MTLRLDLPFSCARVLNGESGQRVHQGVVRRAVSGYTIYAPLAGGSRLHFDLGVAASHFLVYYSTMIQVAL